MAVKRSEADNHFLVSVDTNPKCNELGNHTSSGYCTGFFVDKKETSSSPEEVRVQSMGLKYASRFQNSGGGGEGD